MNDGEGRQIRIIDSDAILTLEYAGALVSHKGNAWFGVAVGFRMLQAAGIALSRNKLWDREDLYVVSRHPGDGVRDVVEYVTSCVSRRRYRVEKLPPGENRPADFTWEVADGAAIAMVALRESFVPDEFHDLLRRRDDPEWRMEDNDRFDALNRRLALRVWDERLTRLFDVKLSETMAAGDD